MKPELKFLSDAEIKLIYDSAIRILSEIGMVMPHPEVIKIMKEAGAEILDKNLVRISPDLVKSAMKTVPKRGDVILYGQETEHDVCFVDRLPTNVCMTMAVDVIDPWSNERRTATNEDLARLTWLADQMPIISINGGLVTPQDVPGAYNDWYTWATTLKYTKKHITGGMLGARCVKDAVEMASVAVGGIENFRKRPCISGWVLTLPCLAFDFESIDAMIEMNKQNIPIILTSGPMVGATSPMSCAGTLAQTLAEILGAITLTQLVNPGAPVIFCSFVRSLDMRTAIACMGSPESGMMRSAMGQIGKWFDLPVRMPCLLRDSKVLDAQAGFETGMTGVLGAINSDQMDSMQLDSDLVVDYADLVFTPDCVEGLQRIVKGINVSQEHLDDCFETIKAVGPMGSFLDHPKTLKNCRKELWHPKVLNRQNYNVWKDSGARDVRTVAIEKVQSLLNEMKGPYLSEKQCAQIDEIVENAQK